MTTRRGATQLGFVTMPLSKASVSDDLSSKPFAVSPSAERKRVLWATPATRRPVDASRLAQAEDSER